MAQILVIVQARMGSLRFPGKVMRQIGGVPMIELMLRRLALAKRPNRIILATPESPGNTQLVSHVRSLGYDVFQGSEQDVLDRYFRAAEGYKPDVVVRLTGDCPLIDPAMVDRVIEEFLAHPVDYASNNHPPTFPDGLDTEVFSFSALARAWQEATEPYDREHVTPYLRQAGRFRTLNIENDKDQSLVRWTVDEAVDFDVIKQVFAYFAPREDFSWQEVQTLYAQQPEIFEVNRHIPSNQGAAMKSGPKLWKRAKAIIPGGGMLLSKRAEMFLPDQWPAYFSHAKGCHVWDLDGNKYADIFMGVGPNTLGYGHPAVDEAVTEVVRKGNMSSLNCPEEVALAERLIDMHHWADMARLARTGGEGVAIAVRIARAASGRDKVAFCGYHGWHDWYLAANLAVENGLEGHLLSGLEPAGVPRGLAGTALPFGYNRIQELEALVKDDQIGVIVMEVMRNRPPEDNFLQKVRDLATAKGIVLIFDECTSGFRQTFGGLHKQFDVSPDMAVFGKTLGNGYAITAILGRREVMEAAQSTFISSTFWTERIGPAAALRTLDVMEQTRSWEQITDVGQVMGRRWADLGIRHGLCVEINGLPAISTFSIKSPHMLEYKTLITQEMLGRGYLTSTGVYACVEHTSEVIERYTEALDAVFGLIRECEDGRPVQELLKGPVCHSGFQRLN